MTVRVYRELFVVSIFLRLWRETVFNVIFWGSVHEEEMLLKVHWGGFTLLPYYGWEHIIIIVWFFYFTLSEVTHLVIIQNRWCFLFILLDYQTTCPRKLNQRKSDGITSIYFCNRRWTIRVICVTLAINQVLIKERFLSLSSRILDTLALYHHRTPLWLLLWDHLFWLCNWICRLLMTRLRWRPFDHLVRR